MNWFKKKSDSEIEAEAKPNSRPTSFSNPFVINSPKLGIYNLLGEAGKSLVEGDKLDFSSTFSAVIKDDTQIPICDVLFLYCHIEDSGKILNSTYSLREIIYKSHAPIVVIPSPNLPDAYIAASKRPGLGRANIVMVLDRKNDSFTKLFVQLFSSMKQGKTMPIAWVDLAPQTSSPIPNASLPESIFSCEAGHIIFR